MGLRDGGAAEFAEDLRALVGARVGGAFRQRDENEWPPP